MPHPLVVHCKREPFDIYVGRKHKTDFPEGSIWGNPFWLPDESQREVILAKYTTWLSTQDHLLQQIHTLKGKKLGCWCSPRNCHADVLAALANEEEL